MELLKIIKYLDKKFNEKIAADWDNVGLQQIAPLNNLDLTQEITNVMVCLDLNEAALNFAIENKIQLIITRHPFIFGEIAKAKKEQKEQITRLKKNKIVVYSIHTNFDASPNQNLLELIETRFSISKVKRFGQNNEGYAIRLKEELLPEKFITKFSKLFPLQTRQVTSRFNFNKPIRDFKIVTGAGGSELIESKLENDVFVTGELKWNEAVYANDHHVSVLILGHYMENYFVNYLGQLLQDNFNDLTIATFDIMNQVKNY